MPVKLRCGCEVTDDGKIVISIRCKNCLECNTAAKMHPFGTGRL